jgi:cellobiose transport system substrate-binding protein
VTKTRTMLVVGLAGVALLATACGSDDDDGTSSGTGDEQIELTVATFGTMGLEPLIAEYEDAHPNITITHRNTGEGGPYHQDLYTKLGANGAGLSDVIAIEEGHIGGVMEYADLFNDLNEIGPDTSGRWLDWKTERATTPDGKLMGYGTDVGPLAVCYRKDLFQAAGLPSEPEQVAPLFETWDDYFAQGKAFVEKSDAAWFDSATQMFNAMVNQLPVGFSNEENELVIETNDDLRATWDQVTTAVNDGLSAKLAAWSDEWSQGFASGAFATQACPSWMLGVIEGNSGPENAGKWAVADVFPGGAGNWGGAWLAVPTESEHPAEAAELAAWLTAPEQQIKAFEEAGTFPSQVDALTDPVLLDSVNAYFNNQQIGALFASRAEGVVAQHKGPNDGPIQENASSPALQSVEAGTSSDEAWQQFVTEAKQIAEG